MSVEVWHHLQVRERFFLSWFWRPRPSTEWKFKTKQGVCFRPLPSSPWNTIGNVFCKKIFFWRASSKTGCSGRWSWKFCQNFFKMAPSRHQSGFFRPTSMWLWLPLIKNFAQSLILKTGKEKPALVSNSDFRTGRDKLYLSARSLWQSRSPLASERWANSTKPWDLRAAAFPTSCTKPLAARITAAHGA